MSNNAPRDADYYLEQLEALKPAIAQWSQAAVTEQNAGEVRDLIGKIKALAKDAEGDRKAIKEPYLEQGRKIDAQFKPVAATAESYVKPLNQLLSAYLQEQERIRREAAEAARKKAEEEAKRAAALKDDEFAGEVMAERAKLAEIEAARAVRMAENNTVQGSESDRAMGLRTYRKARVTNAAMLVGHFANHPEVVALCEKLANAQIRAAKGGEVSIPGIEVIEEKKVA